MTNGKQVYFFAVLAFAVCVNRGTAQNYRVRADAYGKSGISEETNPASVQYAIVDLGVPATGGMKPIRVTNSGYVLLADGDQAKRWHNGQLETLTGGEDWVDGVDINEAGTVVGGVIISTAQEPSPAIGKVSSYPGWYDYDYWSGTGVAAKWNAGQTTASFLGEPSFTFFLENIDDASAYPFTGSVRSSWPRTIDNNGTAYGTALINYQQHEVVHDDDGWHCCTPWGSFWSGYQFTGGVALGNQHLVDSPDGYSVQGDEYHINKARNLATIGGSYIDNPPYATIEKFFINGAAVDTNPLLPAQSNPYNLNSRGAVLLSAPGSAPPPLNSFTGYYIFDAATNVLTDLLIKPPDGYLDKPRPVALNDRVISVVDESGNVTTKVSPQIVGSTPFAPAVIWEENPKTHQYVMQYLDQLIPPDSGWKIDQAYDINDNGVIAATAVYQAIDGNGNPTGQPQKKTCLLWPMKDIYVFFGIRALDPNAPPGYLGNHSELQSYLNQVEWKSERADYFPVVAGAQTNPPFLLVKGANESGVFGRVHVHEAMGNQAEDPNTHMQAFQAALATPGAYVTFNGHANMGVGPAFTFNVGGLGGFMHVSGRGTAAISAVEYSAEGYSFTLRPYVAGDPANEVLTTALNYQVPFVDLQRFPNENSVLPGDAFHLQAEGATAYHYTNTTRDFFNSPSETRNYTLVYSGSSELPNLRYKWFYFDGCNSGRDYIESFQHGSVFYTTQVYGNLFSTKLFVSGVIEGQQEEQVRDRMNADDPEQPFNRFYPFN